MHDDRFLTKVFDSSRGPTPPSDMSGSSVPAVLLSQSTRRIPIVAAAALCVQIVGWVVPLTARGAFLEEFTRVWDWVPPVTAIVASISLIVASKVLQLQPRIMITLGLLYQVVVSYSVTFSQYWTSFTGVTAEHINGDIVGMTVVAVWMVFYTVIVPTRPRSALVALLGSSSAPGVVYFLSMNVGDAPALESQHFFFVFVFPYLLVAASAYIAALIVYRLGQAVTEAREMGSYRLEDRLGAGGMGEVWRASHRMLARPAAVKLVRTDSLGWDQDTAVARFEREAQVTAALQSPHTVELYDYGVSDDGTIYYVMELLDGVDLDELVKSSGALPPERVAHILHQLCLSLGEAHRMDLIHRDVKPANIFLCKRAFEFDFVKVLDFGLVRKHSAVDPEVPSDDLSKMGVVMGTPAYMAPEVIQGEPADARSDVYAVGCVAYWLLTGERVFDAPTLAALLVAHASQDPVPPSRRIDAEVPASLEAIVLDCLVKNPADRIQSAEEIVNRLARVEFVESWTPQRAESWWKGK
jgi:serine/threonine-protein kinase